MGIAAAQTEQRASARDRLLAAANELFYAEGVQTAVSYTHLLSTIARGARRYRSNRNSVELGGSGDEHLAEHLIRERDECTLRVVRRLDRRRLGPGMLAGRVGEIRLEHHVVGISEQSRGNGVALVPEAAVNLAPEVLGRQQVVFRMFPDCLLYTSNSATEPSRST